MIDSFMIRCTEEQTKRALELGAQILLSPEEYKDETHFHIEVDGENVSAVLPSSEEMIGWMESLFFKEVNVQFMDDSWEFTVYNEEWDIVACSEHYPSRRKATLAAIDTALDYLERFHSESH